MEEGEDVEGEVAERKGGVVVEEVVVVVGTNESCAAPDTTDRSLTTLDTTLLDACIASYSLIGA